MLKWTSLLTAETGAYLPTTRPLVGPSGLPPRPRCHDAALIPDSLLFLYFFVFCSFLFGSGSDLLRRKRLPIVDLGTGSAREMTAQRSVAGFVRIIDWVKHVAAQ